MKLVKNWVIYKITSPSGRIYIGKSSSWKSRLSSYKNLSGAKNQPILLNSLNKYGFDNHIIEIIDTFIGDSDYASGKEIFWIRSYMSNSKKWGKYYNIIGGLNMTDGGEGMLGYKYSDESREKMSKSGKGKPKYKLRGRPLSEETKRKLSEKAKLRPSPTKGKKYSEERKIKIGLSKIGNKNMLGKNHSDETKEKMKISKSKIFGKPILQFDLNSNFLCEYISKREASRVTGICRNVIDSSIRGCKDKRHKYIFKYK